MLDAWQFGEFAGEGALRIPTFPIRAVLVAMALLAALAFLLRALTAPWAAKRSGHPAASATKGS